jgi:hypothetical protein
MRFDGRGKLELRGKLRLSEMRFSGVLQSYLGFRRSATLIAQYPSAVMLGPLAHKPALWLGGHATRTNLTASTLLVAMKVRGCCESRL